MSIKSPTSENFLGLISIVFLFQKIQQISDILASGMVICSADQYELDFCFRTKNLRLPNEFLKK